MSGFDRFLEDFLPVVILAVSIAVIVTHIPDRETIIQQRTEYEAERRASYTPVSVPSARDNPYLEDETWPEDEYDYYERGCSRHMC